MRGLRLKTAIGRGALALPLLVAVGAAPAEAGHRHATVTYEVTELESLGGTSSAGNSINDRGLVGGTSREPVDDAMRATLWRYGSPTNLGTLGGPNSAILWPAKNNRGTVVGVTETADIDPLDEEWSCSVFFGVDTEHACVGFVWERGEMRALPTFGGTHGFATGANTAVRPWAGPRLPTRTRPATNPRCSDSSALSGTRVQAACRCWHRFRELASRTTR